MSKQTFLQTIDIFGLSYTLSFNKQRLYQTSLGGVFTILHIILCLTVLVFFLIQFFQRGNNPSIIQFSTLNPYRNDFDLSNAFSYRIQDIYGNEIAEAMKYLQFEAFFYNNTPNNSTVFNPQNTVNTSILTRLCNSSDFSKDTTDQFKSMNLQNSTCFDRPSPIGGYFDQPYIWYYSFQLNKCQNTTTKKNCKSSEEINNFLNSRQMMLGIYYEELSINSTNITNPVYDFISLDSYIIDNSICKKENYFLEYLFFSTDFGWITNSFIWKLYLRFSLKETRFYSKINPQDKCLIHHEIFSSNSETEFTRSYQKVQNFLAQFVTIIGIIKMFFEFLTNFIYSKMMDQIIIKNIFDLKNDDLDNLRSNIEIKVRNNDNDLKKILENSKDELTDNISKRKFLTNSSFFVRIKELPKIIENRKLQDKNLNFKYEIIMLSFS